MQYYVSYEKNGGKILGYLVEGVNKITAPSKKITKEEWQAALDSGANYFIDGKLVFVDETTEEQKAASLGVELIALCDSKQKDAFKLVLGWKYSEAQLKRYDDKYARAKADEFDAATNQAIIQKYEAMQAVVRGLVGLIEMFREAVSDMIVAGELEKAKAAIEAGKSFDQNTTPEKVAALLGA